MGDQLALLRTLDDALLYFNRVERERDEALTRLEALQQDVNILRALLPQVRPGSKTAVAKNSVSPAHSVVPDPDGLYNNGCRDRVLRWLAATLRKESDPELRRWVTLALGVMGDPRSVQAISSALDDADKGLRREAVVALGRIGTAHVVAPLAVALGDSDKSVRDKATAALGRMGRPAISALISGLRDDNAIVRRGSSDALTVIGVPAIAPLAKSLLEENSRLARIGAIETLGRMRSGRAVAPLIVALMEPDTRIQEAAAQALARTGQPAIRPLIRMLSVADPRLRQRTAEILVGTRGLAVKPLIEALGDNRADVRRTASEALVRIGKPALRPLRSAVKNHKPAIRLEGATVLGLTADSRAVAPLVQAVKGKDRDLRQRAAAALTGLGRPAAVSLVCLLRETDPGIREQASQALAQIGRPAFEPLCRALYEADFGTRWEAARVLDKLRSSGVLRGLHGKWERTVDHILLMAWFNSGWAQCATETAKLRGGRRRQDGTRFPMHRPSTHRKRNLEESGNAP